MANLKDSLDRFFSFQFFAEFLLRNAFVFADRAASEVVMYHIAEDQLMRGASPGPDYVPPKQPESITEWLEHLPSAEAPNYEEQVESALYTERALENANEFGPRVHATDRLTSHALAAHVILVTTLLEAVVNRQLFFLRHTGSLAPELYASIDRAEILPKIMFSFKEEIQSGRLTTSRIKRLVSLRNKAVHYKEESSSSLTMTMEELLASWCEVGKLLAVCPGEPTEEHIQYFIERFKKKWL